MTPLGGPDLPPARERLQRDYRPAFQRYLSRRDEQSRLAGYLLGRAALDRGDAVLDLVAAHHVTLVEVLPDAQDPGQVLAMCTAAAEFLTEVLAPWSMASSAAGDLRRQLREAQAEVAQLRSRSAGEEPGPDGTGPRL